VKVSLFISAAVAIFSLSARAGFTSSGTIGNGDLGAELEDGKVYVVSENTTLSRTTPYSALYVKSGATTVIYVKKGVTLTVNGGNASGTEGAGAGIRVNDGSTLIVTGGGNLNVTGGNATNGANGSGAGECYLDMDSSHGGNGGAGGNGGGGAAAAIGGAGGNGGNGGASPANEDWVETNDTDDYDRNGKDGNNGGAGTAGGSCGTVYLLGALTVNATAGNADSATGGSAGSDTYGEHEPNGTHINWYYVGGAGGGGGGAGGIAASYSIGGGGGGGGGGGSGGNGGLYWAGNYGTGTAHKPDGAGGQGGWDNGVSSSRTSPDYAQSSSGSYYKRGGLRGSGGAKGSNGTDGSVRKDVGVSFSGTGAFSDADTHSAIEYTLKFSDGLRIDETMTAKLGYALPTPPTTPSRSGWTFNGWFTGKNGTGTKYYDANGTAVIDEYFNVGDVTLYASWTSTDPSAAGTITINGTTLVGGISDSGYGWSYDGDTGILRLYIYASNYVITGTDNVGEFSILADALCSVTLSNLTINASANNIRPPFEAVAGKSPLLTFKGTNHLYGPKNHPAVYIQPDATLTIRDSGGTLTAYGGANAPGIGGKVGDTSGTGTLNIEGGTITANGGTEGSGIGAAKGSGFGTVMISGGTITAKGSALGAGIGGSNGAGMGTYIISGGTVNATGGSSAPGIGCGPDGIGGSITISGGTVTARGGNSAAGIGGGQASTFGSITITGGDVTAIGGISNCAAAIGGGYNGKGGAIKISGGNVTANANASNHYGAGIGSGDASRGNMGMETGITVEITGGFVTATSRAAAGIGPGDYTKCGAITITGGTVYARTSNPSGRGDIGKGTYYAESVTIQGGAVYSDRINPDPKNRRSENVYLMDFDIGVPTNKVVSFSMGTYEYGLTDVYTDSSGNLRLWLPSTGDQKATVTIEMADGSMHYFCFIIDENGKRIDQEFLMVNGAFVVEGIACSGVGWHATADGTVYLESSPLEVTGLSTGGVYRIIVAEDAANAVTLSKLTLVAPNKTDSSALYIANAACTLTLQGDNILAGSGSYSAGIGVAKTATLTITGGSQSSATATSAPLSALYAIGGKYAAGIGSVGGFDPPGKIVIESGLIEATGGDKAAGIGGGANSNLEEGNITINGGVVIAQGGTYAAGIGAGQGKLLIPNGAVVVNGGTVTAYGGSGSASDFVSSAGNTLNVTGDGQYKSTVINGGSVIPGTTGTVEPRPVDEAGNILYRVLIDGFTPGEEVSISCEDLPESYSTEGIVADSDGRICLWMAATNHAHTIIANGQYYETPYPYAASSQKLYTTDSNMLKEDGGAKPPESQVSDKDPSITLWRVTVPGLTPGASVALDLSASHKVIKRVADADGEYFFYVADGGYLFKVNGVEYCVVVSGGPAIAKRTVGLYVNGLDVCLGGHDGWTVRTASSAVMFTNAGPFTVTGKSSTYSLVAATNNVDLTISGVTLDHSPSSGRSFSPISVAEGASLALTLDGNNIVRGYNNLAGVGVAASASLLIGGGGVINASSCSNAAGIGGDYGKAAGIIEIAGGSVVAVGGESAAGIGSGAKGKGSVVNITGGIVAATGGAYGAAIGGGENSVSNVVTISGGDVVASGGDRSAGIGSGDQQRTGTPTGDIVSILGGMVRAKGSGLAVSIGSSSYGSCASVTISGGTVTAYGGSTLKIGRSREDASVESVKIVGGAVYADETAVAPPPVNDALQTVWPVDIPVGTANVMVDDLSIFFCNSGEPVPYGMNDLYTDANGTLRVWLQDGEYDFSVGGALYAAKVVGEATVAYPHLSPIGLLVNGRDIGCRVGPGWAFGDDAVLALSSSSFALTTDRSIAADTVRVVIGGESSVSISNVSLTATLANKSPISLEYGSVVTLTLAGTNIFTAGASAAGVGVSAGSSLTINGDGALRVQGGEGGAGIGGSMAETTGFITIAGGDVRAAGGNEAAGIGSGANGEGGTVVISGGIVRAKGHEEAADIGSSMYGVCLSVSISDGTIYAQESGGSPRIGGVHGFGVPVTFTGGAIYTSTNLVCNAPTNASEAVYPVNFDLGRANSKIESLVLVRDGNEFAYGSTCLYTDENGILRIWLPDGKWSFALDGTRYSAIVNGGETTVILTPEDVTIDSIVLEDGKVKLSVSVQPDGWIASFASHIQVYSSDTLPVPIDDSSLVPAAEMSVVVEADGTATVTLPLGTSPHMFYKVVVL